MIKLYVTGALQGRGSEAFGALKVLAERLCVDGVASVSPSHYMDYANVEALTLKDMMAVRLEKMMQCDIVLTTDDFMNDPCSALEAHVARSLEMEVISYHKWYHEHKTTGVAE